MASKNGANKMAHNEKSSWDDLSKLNLALREQLGTAASIFPLIDPSRIPPELAKALNASSTLLNVITCINNDVKTFKVKLEAIEVLHQNKRGVITMVDFSAYLDVGEQYNVLLDEFKAVVTPNILQFHDVYGQIVTTLQSSSTGA